MRTDAALFIAENVPDKSIDCFHLYFPDPWPKKRHHKRRFVCDTNLTQILRILKPNGTIRIATDHAEYFEQIQQTIASRSDCLELIDFLPTAGADTGEWAGTNFERKYLKQGRAVYTLAAKKSAAHIV